MTPSTTLGYRLKKEFSRLKTKKKQNDNVFRKKAVKLACNRKNARNFNLY
jgi:hypothetical protein